MFIEGLNSDSNSTDGIRCLECSNDWFVIFTNDDHIDCGRVIKSCNRDVVRDKAVVRYRQRSLISTRRREIVEHKNFTFTWANCDAMKGRYRAIRIQGNVRRSGIGPIVAYDNKALDDGRVIQFPTDVKRFEYNVLCASADENCANWCITGIVLVGESAIGEERNGAAE